MKINIITGVHMWRIVLTSVLLLMVSSFAHAQIHDTTKSDPTKVAEEWEKKQAFTPMEKKMSSQMALFLRDYYRRSNGGKTRSIALDSLRMTRYFCLDTLNRAGVIVKIARTKEHEKEKVRLFIEQNGGAVNDTSRDVLFFYCCSLPVESIQKVAALEEVAVIGTIFPAVTNKKGSSTNRNLLRIDSCLK